MTANVFAFRRPLPGHGFHPEESVHSAVDRVEAVLLSDFSAVLPADLIIRTVGRARAQLAGEVPSESLPEFLHRLAAERLRSLSAKNTRQSVAARS